jgi:hypothetical protein
MRTRISTRPRTALTIFFYLSLFKSGQDRKLAVPSNETQKLSPVIKKPGALKTPGFSLEIVFKF